MGHVARNAGTRSRGPDNFFFYWLPFLVITYLFFSGFFSLFRFPPKQKKKKKKKTPRTPIAGLAPNAKVVKKLVFFFVLVPLAMPQDFLCDGSLGCFASQRAKAKQNKKKQKRVEEVGGRRRGWEDGHVRQVIHVIGVAHGGIVRATPPRILCTGLAPGGGWLTTLLLAWERKRGCGARRVEAPLLTSFLSKGG